MRFTEQVTIVVEMPANEAVKLLQSEAYIDQMLIDTNHGDLVNEASEHGGARSRFIAELDRIVEGAEG